MNMEKKELDNCNIYFTENTKNRLYELACFLKKNNNYYSKIESSGDLFEECYFSFPLLTKRDIKKIGEDFFSSNKTEVRYEPTSGTSGVPFICYKTLGERFKYAKVLWDKRKLIDPSITPDKFVSLLGKISKIEDIEFTDLSENNLMKIIDFIKNSKRTWLSASVTMFVQYSKYILENNLFIDNIEFIELQGEYADRTDRELIEKAFGAKTVMHYGIREVWTIAYECSAGHMHFLEELFIIEHDKIEKELIISSMINKYMPFVRYRTGDKVDIVYQEQCECGKKNTYELLVNVGRKANYIEGSKKLIGDIIFKRVINQIIRQYDFNHNAIFQYSVEQIKQKSFIFHLEIIERERSNIEQLIIKQVKELLGNDTEILFQYDKLHELNNGKNRVFIKNIKE